MIKLEDLKIGHTVYCICSDGLGWHGGLTIRKELFMLDAIPESCEAVCCEGSIEILTRSHEKYLFKTTKETFKEYEKLRLIKAKELLHSEKFIDRLFECAISPKRLSKFGEMGLYELAVKLYKEELKGSEIDG